MKFLSIAALSFAALSAEATTFQITPLTLDNGYTIKGTIDTDGTVGYLSSANIVSWDVGVIQTTDDVYTNTPYTPSANETTTVIVTPPPQISGVSSNGKRLLVQRSPDSANLVDGGSILFMGPGRLDPSWAMIADFTSFSAWYDPVSIIDGVGGWGTALGMSLGAPLTMAPLSSQRKLPQLRGRNRSHGATQRIKAHSCDY